MKKQFCDVMFRWVFGALQHTSTLSLMCSQDPIVLFYDGHACVGGGVCVYVSGSNNSEVSSLDVGAHHLPVPVIEL